MKINKKILAAIIIFGSLIAAISIIIFNNPARQGSAAANLQGQNNPLLQFQRQSANPSAFLKQRLTSSTANFTDLVAQLQFQKLLEQNPDSLSGLLTNNVNAQTQTMDRLPDLMADVNLESQEWTTIAAQLIAIQSFREKDVKTTINDSPANQLRYLLALIESNQSRFTGFNASILTMVNQWMAGQPQKLQQYVALIPQQINDLLALPVPAGLTDFHLKNLNLWQKKYQIYGALTAFDQDPVKSLIALHYIEQLVAETAELNAFLQEKLDTQLED